MNKEFFREIIIQKKITDTNVKEELEDLVQQFPYFQTARILLTKSLYDQQNIQYNDQLKITAAYVADRKMLHKLIMEEPAVSPASDLPVEIPEAPIAETPAEEIIPQEKTFAESVIETISEVKPEVQEEEFNNPVESSFFDYTEEQTETVTDDQPSETVDLEIPLQEEQQVEESKPTPAEILEMRLKEISERTEKTLPAKEEMLGADEAEWMKEESKQESVLEEEEPAIISESDVMIDEVLPVFIEQEEPVNTVEVREEHKEPETNSAQAFQSTNHSFIDWLHQYALIKKETGNNETGSYADQGSEEKKAEETDKPANPDDLIERFIKAEPRIDASKARFFSPVNMARNSLVDHDELISETLALIYFEQGNLSKAIQTLEKLSLKFPEKSRYFAAQIETLKSKQQS